MSGTLQATVLKDSVSAINNLTFDTSGNTTSGGTVAMQSSFMRNRLINGAMAVDQRNTGASQTFTAGAALAYSVDRWYGYCTGANVTGAQVAGATANQYYYRFTGAASVTGIGFGQRIEAVNCADLAGNAVTLSVDLANSSLTQVTWQVYYANTTNTFGTLASPTVTSIATGTFTVSSTVSRYSAQITLPSAATTGLQVVFTVGAQLAGSTWTIGNVQLEEGTLATVIEARLYGHELSLCQRYFQNTTVTTIGFYASALSQLGYYSIQFPTTMRTAPAYTTKTAPTLSLCNSALSGSSVSDLRVDLQSTVGGQCYAYGGVYSLNSEL